MNQIVLAKLKRWRGQKASMEKCELYRIFQNKTLEEIATVLPGDKESFLAIKGVGEKKFQKYGKDVFAIIQEGSSIEVEKDPVEVENKIYSVSDYLDTINTRLSEVSAKIKGEVSSVSFKGHLYFSLKDKDDGSVIACFMWARDYEMCGIEITEGMELTVHGFSEIYKPNGRFTFRTRAIELVGEGALKLAYEELRKKLEAEGLFDEKRKKPMPEFPCKIGLITSREGAVINDFMSNIGRFGYHIQFVDSRVEGIMAVRDLIRAVKFFKKNPVDVLVMIRGGGSLESLQAFNNEALIREIVELPMPVICGIGHDKDVPLLSYVADRAVSTPSIVAKEINRSWEHARDILEYLENSIIHSYEKVILEARFLLSSSVTELKGFYQNIFSIVSRHEQNIKNMFQIIQFTLIKDREILDKIPKMVSQNFSRLMLNTSKSIDIYEKSLQQNDPMRQLKLGYSIVMAHGRVVKSISDVAPGDSIVSRLADGELHSEIKNSISK
jgi:exodeoxyribonuclease VII large subunit